MLTDHSRRKGASDAVACECTASWVDRLRTGLERPIREGNVGGHDNVAFLCTFRDPVVGGVRPAVDHYPSDSRVRGTCIQLLETTKTGTR